MNNQGLRNLTGKSSIYLHSYWERGEKRDKWTSAFPFHPVNHLIGLLLNRLKTGRRPRVSSLISLTKAFAANITSITKFSEKSLNKEFFGIKSQNSFFFHAELFRVYQKVLLFHYNHSFEVLQDKFILGKKSLLTNFSLQWCHHSLSLP